MSWGRINEIEIDHRVPISYPGVSGDPPTLEEKVARLHYLNCTPLIGSRATAAPTNRCLEPRRAQGPQQTD